MLLMDIHCTLYGYTLYHNITALHWQHRIQCDIVYLRVEYCSCMFCLTCDNVLVLSMGIYVRPVTVRHSSITVDITVK